MKIDRLLAIIIILLNRTKVTASELAQEFEVSLRTIYRYMESLTLAGVPIISHQGNEGGYSLTDNFTINKQYFTGQEFELIMTALQGVQGAVDDNEVDSSLSKLKTLAPKQSRNLPPLIIQQESWAGKDTDIADAIKLVKSSITNSQQVRFNYTDAMGKKSERTMEPVSLVYKALHWYVFGFCIKRNAYRLFKLKRMLDLKKGRSFSPRDTQFSDFPWEGRWEEQNLRDITFKVDKSARHKVFEEFSSQAISEYEDYFQVDIKIPINPWITGVILSFGSAIRDIAPDELKTHIKEEACILSKI